MARSLRPSYCQLGSTGKYELYKPVNPEDRKLPFRFDTLDTEEVAAEYAQEESTLGVLSEEEIISS